MKWLPPSDKHKTQLQSNRAGTKFVAAPRIDLSLPEPDTFQFATAESGIAGVRCRKENVIFYLLHQDMFSQLTLQRDSISTSLQNGIQLLVIAGIGSGHVVESVVELLARYPKSAAVVLEPDPNAWAAAMMLFDTAAWSRQENLFLFNGAEAESHSVDWLGREHTYLVPAEKVSYKLGIIPNATLPAQSYVDLAKSIGQKKSSLLQGFGDRLEHYRNAVKTPSMTPPKRVWGIADKQAYIHLPIARAAMEGFARNGLEPYFDTKTGEFINPFKTVGNLIAHQPDIFFFINAHPGAALRDLGFSEDFVMDCRRPRVTFITDDTSFYDDSIHEYPAHGHDWFFCADRTYLTQYKSISSNAHYLPIATTLAGKGDYRKEFDHPLLYVGSLPDVQPLLAQLSRPLVECLEKVEEIRSSNAGLPFCDCFEQLQAGQAIQNELQNAADEYCRFVGKEIQQPTNRMEYLLYVSSTYFKRKRIVEALLPHGLVVYGPDCWQEALPEQYKAQWRGFMDSQDLPDAYHSARFNLNIHSHQCPACLNVRDFDIAMAGGVGLSDWVEDMDAGLLEPGKELLTFKTTDEAVGLIHQYADNSDSLQRIREQAHERVLREHTFERRAKTILQIISPNSSG